MTCMGAKACQTCSRPIDQRQKEPVKLQHTAGDDLLFCSRRCRRDYLDTLPPNDTILQRHAELVDMVPWGVAYE